MDEHHRQSVAVLGPPHGHVDAPYDDALHVRLPQLHIARVPDFLPAAVDRSDAAPYHAALILQMKDQRSMRVERLSLVRSAPDRSLPSGGIFSSLYGAGLAQGL